ncbi:hypothetical protein [Glycomyces tenuis]|uniref:hypothetical protein n=1 Tax=Glycomyces tenuis TaxID=58116 RepID=UPI0003FDD0DE|nr:hypothetical protein [Glycomyces tenuis]
MKLMVDTSEVAFMVTQAPVPKEFKGEQQKDKNTGALKWVTSVLALEQSDENDSGQIIRIVTAGDKPSVQKTQQVAVAGLEVLPWENKEKGSHGISYRAAEIKVKAAK